VEQAFDNFTAVAAPGCVMTIDQAFVFGANSYEQLIQTFAQEHPNDPEMMFRRSFQTPSGEEFSNNFLGLDPLYIIHSLAERGWTCVDFPTDPKEIKRICEAASADDGWIVDGKETGDPGKDLARQALYRTHDKDRGYNRMKLHFVFNGVPAPDRKAS
jgi:hypothetical protein